MPTFELNNAVRTRAAETNIKKGSCISEVFNAAVGASNRSLGDMNPTVVEDSMNYIKSMAGRAAAGDSKAINEINTLRTIAIEQVILQPITLLGVFGSFQKFGWDETVEREVVKHVGERSRIQAPNGDVVFPVVSKERYVVPTTTISGGYVVDYRRMELGDMTHEAHGIQEVATDILNRAMRLVVETVYNSVKTATGVKYLYEFSTISQSGLDATLNKVRRYGQGGVSIVGDYALVSQIANFAGYKGSNASQFAISDKVYDQIMETGLPAFYKGAKVQTMPNPYDLTTMNSDGSDFVTMLPAGLGFILPLGGNSPIWTATRGGLTSLQGVDVKSGQIVTRFDLEVAVDVARGLEYEIGIIHDASLDDLAPDFQ